MSTNRKVLYVMVNCQWLVHTRSICPMDTHKQRCMWPTRMAFDHKFNWDSPIWICWKVRLDRHIHVDVLTATSYRIQNMYFVSFYWEREKIKIWKRISKIADFIFRGRYPKIYRTSHSTQRIVMTKKKVTELKCCIHSSVIWVRVSVYVLFCFRSRRYDSSEYIHVLRSPSKHTEKKKVKKSGCQPWLQKMSLGMCVSVCVCVQLPHVCDVCVRVCVRWTKEINCYKKRTVNDKTIHTGSISETTHAHSIRIYQFLDWIVVASTLIFILVCAVSVHFALTLAFILNYVVIVCLRSYIHWILQIHFYRHRRTVADDVSLLHMNAVIIFFSFRFYIVNCVRVASNSILHFSVEYWFFESFCCGVVDQRSGQIREKRRRRRSRRRLSHDF